MKTNRIIQLAAGVLLLTACSSEIYEEYVNGRTPINLGYEVLTAQEATRTAAATNLNDANIAAGRAVKVCVSTDGGTSYTGYDYTTVAGGSMTAPSNKPYYPAEGTVKIVAYHPVDAGSTFTVAADQTSDDNYNKSDLMFSNNITNQAKTSDPVTLQFTHKMAKLVVTATAGEDVSEIRAITLKQVKRQVSFDQTTGDVGEAEVVGSTDVVLFKDGTATTGEGAALIPAQTITGDVIEVVTDLGTATYNVPAGKAFAANTKYTIGITVNRTAVGAINCITWPNQEELTVQPISGLYIDNIDDQTYNNGTALKPSFTIKKANGTTVATISDGNSTSDFNIYWQNNTNAGTATVAAVGKSGTSYAGMSCAKDFTINKADCSVTLSTTSLAPQVGNTGTFTVTRSGDGTITANSSNTNIATVSVSGTTVTVTAVAAGTATITITVAASANYNAYTATNKTVEVTVPTDIQECDLSAATSEHIGLVICSNGHVHTTGNPNCEGSVVGILGKVTETGHGLIVAMKDATDQTIATIWEWSYVNSYASTILYLLPDDTARGSLASYTSLGSTTVSNWGVASSSDYDTIFKNLGSQKKNSDIYTYESEGYTYDSNVNAYFINSGGCGFDGNYLSCSSAYSDGGGPRAWAFGTEYWMSIRKNSYESYHVRPLLAF